MEPAQPLLRPTMLRPRIEVISRQILVCRQHTLAWLLASQDDSGCDQRSNAQDAAISRETFLLKAANFVASETTRASHLVIKARDSIPLVRHATG